MEKLIVGNWKMNTTRAEAHALAKGLQEAANAAVDMVICPPAVWLADIAAILKAPLLLGAQDCHAADKGAFTGNIAASMLKELGCAYVIVGHSERRAALHSEDNATVKAKAMAAIKHGLIPIICVGESAEEREAGSHEVVVGQQLVESLPNNGHYVVAYEPVWAIGTGKTATIGDVEAMHLFIRDTLAKTVDQADKVAILYGGSVKAANAAEILSTDNVDGVLVGGASLQLEEFRTIAQAAPH